MKIRKGRYQIERIDRNNIKISKFYLDRNGHEKSRGIGYYDNYMDALEKIMDLLIDDQINVDDINSLLSAIKAAHHEIRWFCKKISLEHDRNQRNVSSFDSDDETTF